MNYLNEKEVPAELLRQKVLEKLGRSTDLIRGSYRMVSTIPSLINDNLCRELRKLLTPAEYLIYIDLVINGSKSLMPESKNYSWDHIRNFIDLPPEQHLRAMMQSMVKK